MKNHNVMTIATLRPDGYLEATTVTYANDGLGVGIEPIAGAVNSGLMALNARDGLRLTERSRTPVLSGG